MPSDAEFADALLDEATAQAARDPAVRRSDWQTGTVTAVNAVPGTVDVGTIRARRLESYTAPKVGDRIIVSQSGLGNWVALGRTASAAAAIGVPLHVWKPANTDRASTATPAADEDLQAPLDANAVYRVEFYLHYAAIDLVPNTTTPGGRFKTSWAVPAGATGNRSAIGPDQGQILSSGSAGGTGRWGVHNFGTEATYGDRNSSTNQCFAMEEGLVFTSSAGTLALQWSQSVSNTAPTRLAQGSYLRVTRLA